jgi:hypothetical protein
MKAARERDLKLTVFWGDILYDTKLVPPQSRITVGNKPNDTFVLDLPKVPDGVTGAESLELVRVGPAGDAELQFDDNVSGHVRAGEEFFTLFSAKESPRVVREPGGRYRLRLNSGDKADLAIGHISFYLDWVEKREIVPGARLVTPGNLFLSLIFVTVMGLVFFLMPESEPDPNKPPERLVEILPPRHLPPRIVKVEPPKPPPPPVVKQPARAAMGERKTKTGGAQKGPKGKVALTKPPSSDRSRKTVARTPPRIRPGAVKHRVAEGDQAAPEGEWTGKIGNVVKGLSNIGADAPNVAPSKDTAAPIAQTGTGGFTTEGMKTGGGGKSVGIGRTVGQGTGGFGGTGKLGIAGKGLIEGSSGRAPATTVVDGGLDREVIDSIIRRRQDRIRLCYERQLNFKPSLSGKIAVAFTIGKNGNVVKSDIAEDTMNDAAVRSCVLKEVSTWTFPAPRGGTLVKVEYPFVFESSGHR